MKNRPILFATTALALSLGVFAEEKTPEKPHEAPARTVAWLGVATDEVSPELHSQLSLDNEAGLLVRYISPNSPASAAGLQVHDILLRLDDQFLLHPTQLRKLIESKKEGDVIALAGLRKGKEFQAKVTLGKTDRARHDQEGRFQVPDDILKHGEWHLDLDKLLQSAGASGLSATLTDGKLKVTQDGKVILEKDFGKDAGGTSVSTTSTNGKGHVSVMKDGKVIFERDFNLTPNTRNGIHP